MQIQIYKQHFTCSLSSSRSIYIHFCWWCKFWLVFAFTFFWYSLFVCLRYVCLSLISFFTLFLFNYSPFLCKYWQILASKGAAVAAKFTFICAFRCYHRRLTQEFIYAVSFMPLLLLFSLCVDCRDVKMYDHHRLSVCTLKYVSAYVPFFFFLAIFANKLACKTFNETNNQQHKKI